MAKSQLTSSSSNGKYSKVTFKQELVDRNVVLSVRHLKQFFTMRVGGAKFRTKAVHDVSFDIHKGEVFGLVGESGCGKTTTGRSIIRLYDITSGSVYLNGHRIAAGDRWNQKEIKWKTHKTNLAIKELRRQMRDDVNDARSEQQENNADVIRKIEISYQEKIQALKQELSSVVQEQKQKIRQIKYDNKHVDPSLLSKIQMIFQDPIDSLDPRMTVEDIIQEGLMIRGEKDKKENSKKVIEVLNQVGLIPEYASRYPHEFSGGQRQRIGIARAVIMNPELLICDEPISALDVSVRAQIINLLNDLKDQYKLTILFIAHDLSVVKYFCDRIAVMYFGEIVELTTSDELFKHPLHPYTRALLSAIPKPDPIIEKKRQRIVYNPVTDHDYSKQKPTLTEIRPGHFVLANDEELKHYESVIKGSSSSTK
jgi:oligopeptide transport system ATP-binding protein